MSQISTRPTIGAGRLAHRLSRARQVATAAGLDALVVGVGADLVYLTGYRALLTERPTLLVVPGGRQAHARRAAPRGDGGARLPGRGGGTVEVVEWDETDDPYALVRVGSSARRQAAPAGRSRPSRSPTGSGRRSLLRLQDAASVDEALAALLRAPRAQRMVKDPEEVALLRAAARPPTGSSSTSRTAGSSAGREADVSREVRDRLLAEGHDEASFAIVASGPTSASPHHDADRPARSAPASRSSSTSAACSAATAATSPGRSGSPAATRPTDPTASSSRCTRSSVRPRPRRRTPSGPASRPSASTPSPARSSPRPATDAHFIHRTGHGIGLEEHEEPYIVAGQHRADPHGDGVQRRAGHLPRGALRRPHRGRRHRAARTARSSSTRSRGSSSSSTADRRPSAVG